MAGEPTYDGWYFYSPVATVLTVPASLLPTEVALVAWALARASVVAATAWWVLRDRPASERALGAAAAVFFIGTLHDLVLGNTNIVIGLAMALVVWGPRRPWTGIPLGIATAAFLKPLIIPFLIWVFIRRRTAIAGAAAGAALALVVAFIMAGPTEFSAFLTAVAEAGRYVAPFSGNVGISSRAPWLVVPAAIVALALATWATWRDEEAGLIAAIAAGLLVSPYVGLYAAAPLLVAGPNMASLRPRTTVVLAAIAPIGLFVDLLVYVAIVLAMAVVIAASRRGGEFAWAAR
jgi:hypothetical protein